MIFGQSGIFLPPGSQASQWTWVPPSSAGLWPQMLTRTSTSLPVLSFRWFNQEYYFLTLSIVITDIISVPLERRGFRKKRTKCWSWNYWSHPDSLITFLRHPSITMTIFGVTTHCNHCNHCQGPYRHYILNALWILINLLCLVLTLYQVGWATITVPCLAVHTFLGNLSKTF